MSLKLLFCVFTIYPNMATADFVGNLQHVHSMTCHNFEMASLSIPVSHHKIWYGYSMATNLLHFNNSYKICSIAGQQLI
jgi:hypothetical protein